MLNNRKSSMIFLLACLITMHLLQLTVTQEYYICGVRGTDDQQCEQINNLNSTLGCQLFDSRLACLKNMSQLGGPVMFGRMTPDEAVFVNKKIENIEVVAEMRSFNAFVDQSVEYSLVVITKKNINHLEDLRGKSYCHPGFGKWKLPRSALTQWERILFKYINNTCPEDKVLLINDVCRLKDFFGYICRPDSLNYKEFANSKGCNFDDLCSLCDSNKECLSLEINEGFKASMNCFNNGGDVALTTLDVVEQHNMTYEVRYVCNGHIVDEVCTSYKRFWPMIVTNSNHRDAVVGYVERFFREKLLQPPGRSRRSTDLQTPVFKILLPHVFDRILIHHNRLNLWSFVNDQQNRTSIQSDIRWCVTSTLEHDECNWWKEAMQYEDLDPNIECIYREDELACVDAVNNESADLVAVGEIFRCVAESKGLKTLAELLVSKTVKTVVVVEKDSVVNSWNDLLGKPACMVKFGDAASTSFLSVLSKNIRQSMNTPRGACNATLYEATREFVDCNHYVQDVCSSMQETGGADEALQCLTKTHGYAVLENQGITVDTSRYRVICQNETLANHNGLEVDDQCYLPYRGFLMVKTRKKHIENFLKLFEKVIGESSVNPVNVFGKSLNGKDLIIKDEVIGFDFLDEEELEMTTTKSRDPERNNAMALKNFQLSTLFSIIAAVKMLL